MHPNQKICQCNQQICRGRNDNINTFNRRDHEIRKKNDELKKLDERPVGNSEQILQNPGSVTYEDLRAYMDKKQSERYKNNNI